MYVIQPISQQFFTFFRTSLPFPIRKLQVDNGTEFPLAFALTVQQAGVRLRYITPRCSEQNGKVERSHRVEEEEFWSRTKFGDFARAAEAMCALEGGYN